MRNVHCVPGDQAADGRSLAGARSLGLVSGLPGRRVETLFPGYFALVMATGIVAIAAGQQDLDWLADVLFAIAVAAYVVLAALLVGRLVRYPRALVDDLTSHAKGFAFLTVVAATNVVGSGVGGAPRLVGARLGAVVRQPCTVGGPRCTRR